MKDSPDDLRDLDRLLQSVQFQPRTSLGAEVVGRLHRGETTRESPSETVRLMLGIGGVVLLLGLGLFVFWLLVLRPVAVFTTDRCCQDLDGGGAADDGLVVVSQKGETVERLAIYEDRDGSRSFTAADTVRFQRNGVLALAESIQPGVRTVEFCCLDYDGGGPSDDALVVVGLPPDRISMAAIYERRATAAPAKLR
ncbi:MAG TPA: hypothetical protein VH879_02615 [Gemmatimonadales bacterium]|jgi:hypothetical protein